MRRIVRFSDVLDERRLRKHLLSSFDTVNLRTTLTPSSRGDELWAIS